MAGPSIHTEDVNTFNLYIDKFVSGLGISAEKILKKVAFDLLKKVVSKTPVDTGRARSAWFTGVNDRPTQEVPPLHQKIGEDQAANESVSRGKVFESAKLGDTLWVANNLPYIERLENGSSDQAPAGMAALSIQEIQAEFDRIGRTL